MLNIEGAVWAWCFEQLSPWYGQHLDLQHFVRTIIELNRSKNSFFIFCIDDDGVSVCEKPGAYTIDQINLGIDANTRRALQYLNLLNLVTPNLENSHGIAIIGLDVSDGGIPHCEIPIFSFQKPDGAKSILLPDIDFLRCRFYESDDFQDIIPYDEKRTSAIFAGSTSGGIVTKSAIDHLTLPRLRAAVYFKNRPEVIFKLPNIVQYDSDETKQYLQKMGLGDRHISLAEQFCHKFLVSIDGNGAACSRVIVGLKSNSALVKYESAHRLFYFNTLIPWFHFIPITCDEQLPHIVDFEQCRPGNFKAIASEGQKFANEFLSKTTVLAYTRRLIEEYRRVFYDISTSTKQSEGGVIATDHFLRNSLRGLAKLKASVIVRICVHIRNRGDVWFKCGDWAESNSITDWIEGFSISLDAFVGLTDIEYKAILDDGSHTDWCSGSTFCGTRGHNKPIRGICIRLIGDARANFECCYQIKFLDGTVSDMTEGGIMGRAVDGSAVRGVRFLIKRRAKN
jgi:hypothetical protein